MIVLQYIQTSISFVVQPKLTVLCQLCVNEKKKLKIQFCLSQLESFGVPFAAKSVQRDTS